MRGHFRYLRFKTFPMTPRTPQCEVFFPLLSSSEHSGVPEDSQPPTFPSVGLHPHTWPKWGCDKYVQQPPSHGYPFLLLGLLVPLLLLYLMVLARLYPLCFLPHLKFSFGHRIKGSYSNDGLTFFHLKNLVSV